MYFLVVKLSLLLQRVGMFRLSKITSSLVK